MRCYVSHSRATKLKKGKWGWAEIVATTLGKEIWWILLKIKAHKPCYGLNSGVHGSLSGKVHRAGAVYVLGSLHTQGNPCQSFTQGLELSALEGDDQILCFRRRLCLQSRIIMGWRQGGEGTGCEEDEGLTLGQQAWEEWVPSSHSACEMDRSSKWILETGMANCRCCRRQRQRWEWTRGVQEKRLS